MASYECLTCADSFDAKLQLAEHVRVVHLSHYGQVRDIPKEESRRKADPVLPCPAEDLTGLTPPLDNAELTEEVLRKVSELRQPESQAQAWKLKLEQLNACLARKGIQGHLEPFGSCNNGFSTVSSDLDLCLNVTAVEAFSITETKKKQFVERYAQSDLETNLENQVYDVIIKALVDCGFAIEEITSKFGARIPILCVESAEFIMDIGIKNQVAIENSRLLRTYSLFDHRVSELGIAIKHWAKRRRLSNAVNRVLCSYAFILLVIRFLQEELVVPNLQQDYPENQPKLMCGRYDCSFEKDLELYEEMKGQNTASVGDLLVRFFCFYSLFDWNTQAIAINKLQVLKPADPKRLIFIWDPFETHRNLGDTVSTENETTIVNEFRRAYKLLCQGTSFEDVCKDS